MAAKTETRMAEGLTRTRIKLCGFTCAQDVAYAAQLGIDAIGLVFYPPSPRAVSIIQAYELARRIPPFIAIIGVFVNAAPQTIRHVTEHVPLTSLQFHGDETPAQCAALAAAARLPWIRALRVTAGETRAATQSALHAAAQDYTAAQGLLLDAPAEGYGGGGKTFDWACVPERIASRIILSGGLHAHNVGGAIARVHPYAVDASSGIEVTGMKGIKDHARMAAFVRAVRAADAA